MNIATYLENIEADVNHNAKQMRKLSAFFKKHGSCWLVKMDKKSDTYLIEWDGDSNTYNFSCSYVVPRYDEKLVELIRERMTAPYEGIAKDWVRVKKISARIEELGGISVIWT